MNHISSNNTTTATTPNLSARAIKRALRDLAEIEANPISGVSVAMPDINNPFLMHANIEIRDGIYEGILIHLIIHIPDEYPIKPPAVNIAPGLDFGHKYHEHIYDNQTHGNSICTDLTSNFAGHFSLIDSYGKPTRSGWTPSYTLSSILVQLQVFFADPDLEKHRLPSNEEVSKLKRHIERFELDVKIDDGIGEEKTVTHSHRNPYPPLSCETAKQANTEEEENAGVKIVNPIQMTHHKASPNGQDSYLSSSSTALQTKGQSQSQSVSSDSVDQSFFEEVKESVITTLKSSESQKRSTTTFEWGKPLTKVTKSEVVNDGEKPSSLNINTKTQIVRVVKPKPITTNQSEVTNDPSQQRASNNSNKAFNKKDKGYNNTRNNGTYNYSYQRRAINNVNSQSGNYRNFNQARYSARNSDRTTYYSQTFSTNKNSKSQLQSSASGVPKNTSTSEIFEETKVQIDDSQQNKNVGEWSAPLKKAIQSKDRPVTHTQVVAVTHSRSQLFTDRMPTQNYNPTPVRYFNLHGGAAPTKSSNELIQLAKREINGGVAHKEIALDKSSIFATVNAYPPNSATPKQIRKEVRDKLVCSVTKVDVFDDSKPVLGYPIDIEKDAYGRLWPIPIMEILSYDAFVFNIQQNFEKLDNYARVKFTSSFGSSYNYWLPIYIDDEHFERSKEHIFNAIAIIYAGVEGKRENDFRPEMVLKVLPPILVKTAVNFLKGTIYQSIVGIDAYCHIYQLLVKMIKIFPELQKMIDQEVQDFCSNEDNRHKRAAGDLGEFMIKLSLSSKGLTNSLARSLVFKEHMARQVSWTLRKDKGLLYNQKDSSFVERFLTASQVANQFALVKLEIAKLLQDSNVKGQLENQCGVLSEETIRIFRSRMKWIQTYVVGDWKIQVEGLEQDEAIYSEEMMRKEIVGAFNSTRVKGYLASY